MVRSRAAISESSSHKIPGLGISLIPVIALICFLSIGISIFEASPHIPIILAAGVAVVVSYSLGLRWKELQHAMTKAIGMAMPAILILMAIGILIGVWTASGIVPLMVDYGLKLLSPSYFLVAACAICAVISFSTGSSWSTIGTVGIALIGTAQGLGISLPMVAGAIVSGSYFGDKLSPLSDTTNLAPAVSGSELFEHIRHMLYTTVPSMVIALILYTILGLQFASSEVDLERVNELSSTLHENFVLNPLLLLAPIAVIVMVALKVPALPAIMVGSLSGAVLGFWIQDMSVGEVLSAMQVGYVSNTGVPHIDELLSRGGLDSMFYTISLILCSMAFGGLMEGSRMLATIAMSILRIASSSGRLVLSVISTCIGMNIIAPDQYLSIIMPGRMYKDAFQKANLAPKNLSRCLEDAGTLSSPLIPWNTCGAFVMGTLMVNPLLYLPFAFLNLLNPVISIIYGFTGLTMTPADKQQS